jgi:hypothetical protein
VGASVLTIGVFFYLRTGFHYLLIKKSHKKESWLPVVNDQGQVIGRVAKSVSREQPGFYQHPLVRLLVWCDHSILLRPRDNNLGFEVGKLDHPLERLIPYGQTAEEVVCHLAKKYFPTCLPPRFLLKYKEETATGQWLVLLYLVKVDEVSLLKGLLHQGGKLWPLKQISANYGMSCFSSLFEGEFLFVQTILSSIKKQTSSAV